MRWSTSVFTVPRSNSPAMPTKRRGCGRDSTPGATGRRNWGMEQVTRGELLFFGKDGAAQSLPLPPQVSWVLKDADGTMLDYAHFGLPLLLAPDALFARVRNLTVRYMPPGTLFPTE